MTALANWPWKAVIIAFLGILVSKRVCADCPSGEELDAETQTCRKCAVGFYRAAESHDICQKCPTGVITRHLGATSVNSCNMSIGSKAKCPSGTEWVSRLEKCVVCGKDTYRLQGVDYWCVECPPGTFTRGPGATSPTDCTGPCEAGSEWDTLSSDCYPCPSDSYREQGAAARCQHCPDGHVTLRRGTLSPQDCIALSDASQILSAGDCPPGTQWNTVSKSCDRCASNQYSSGGESGSCQPCETGLVTLLPGAADSGVCMDPTKVEELRTKPREVITCPLGSEWSSLDEGCKPCPRGFYKDNLHHQLCGKCADGHSTSVVGATSAHFCSIGGVPPGLRLFEPDDCPVGTEWISASSLCRTCRVGFYRDTTASTHCLQCQPGTTTPYPGSSSAEDCALPAVNIHGAPRAFHLPENCPSGSEWSSVYSMCQPCLLGFYRDHSESLLACQMCPAGYTTFYMGSKSRELCNVPVEGPDKIPIDPINGCEPGYQPNNLNTECIICPIRSYKRGQGFGYCGYCPVNKTGEPGLTQYRGASSQTMCLEEVEILNMEPQEGRVSGMYPISLQFQPRDSAVRLLNVSVAGVACALHYYSPLDGHVNCTVGPSHQSTPGELTVSLADGRTLVLQKNFTFFPDPVIAKIGRTKVFASGGVNITVSGSGFKMARARMTLTPDQTDRNKQALSSSCVILDETVLRCPVPDMTGWFGDSPGRARREAQHQPLLAYLGYDLGGYMAYQNVSRVMPEVGPLLVYLDPDIKPLTGEASAVTMQPNSSLTLTLQGSALNVGAIPEDYQIFVGEYHCKVIQLQDSFMQCSISATDAAKIIVGQEYPAKVNIGPFTYQPGRFTFSRPKPTTATAGNSGVTPTVAPPRGGEQPTGGQTPTPGGNTSPKNSTPASPTSARPTGGDPGRAISPPGATPVPTSRGGQDSVVGSNQTPVPGSNTVGEEGNSRSSNSGGNDAPGNKPSGNRIDVKLPPVDRSSSESPSVSEESSTDLVAILVPVLVSICVMAVIVIVVAILYCHRRKDRLYSDGSLMRHSQISSSGSESSLGDGFLPPLPFDSVFGPERVTDRGVKQRQLSLPSDRGGGVSTIETSKPPAEVTYSYSTYSTGKRTVLS